MYIHVEIWRDYDQSVINRAAADWLWLLEHARLPAAEHAQLRDSHRVFVCRPA